MKKLKNKLFFVIFCILSFFLIGVILFYNYQNYQREYNNIEDVINRMSSVHNRFELEPKPNMKPDGNIRDELKDRIFMDSIVYTIMLENNEIKEIFSHTDVRFDEEDIKNVALDIIKSNEEYSIGNLFIEEYCFYRNDKSITVVDNSIVKDRLLSNLLKSFIVIIILEVVIFIISLSLTRWIIRPAEESFIKQKQFIADASHELKTPLSVIIANVDMLEKDRKNDKWINNIKNEADGMNNLICSLLDLAKLEDDSNVCTVSKCNLSKLVEKSILPFEGIMYEKNIKFCYEIECGIEYECDESKIKQLISILVDNSIRHSKKNGNVIVVLKKEKDNVILQVKNKGLGIKKGEEDKIFERFYRADNSRNRSENRYGLGLAIAKSIVEFHKGIIIVEQENEFTVFSVILKKL